MNKNKQDEFDESIRADILFDKMVEDNLIHGDVLCPHPYTYLNPKHKMSIDDAIEILKKKWGEK